MTEQEVCELMKSSKTENEWNANCDKVKQAFDGKYPSFWFMSVVVSGLLKSVAAQWGSDGEIKVY